MKKSVFAPVILLTTAAPMPVFAAEQFSAGLSAGISAQTLLIAGFFLVPLVMAALVSRQQPVLPEVVTVEAVYESDHDVFGFDLEDSGTAQPPVAQVVESPESTEDLSHSVITPAVVLGHAAGLRAA